MKKTSYIALSLLALAGCQAVEITPSIVESSSKVFTASTEIATKTSLDNELNVRWSANDQVSVFAANTHNDKYQVSPESAGQTSADLNYVSGTGFTAGTELPANIAYYPYSSTTTIAKAAEAYNLNVTLPETQTYAANSFSNGAFPMVAVTATAENRNFAFKNICGALKLQLKGTASIASIAVSGNNNEILCGTATVTAQNSAVPTIAMTGSGKTVTLDCGAGVQLNESTATQFVIVLPPVAMTGGFTALITDTDGGTMEVSTTKSKTIERSGILKMGEVTYEAESPRVNDLSAAGTANCYIVNEYGPCTFDATKKGNTNESVGTIASAVVLWESFGTDVQPEVGDIVSNVSVSNGIVAFTASGQDGNAVIAVKNDSGDILWSWHIWVCKDFDPAATAHEYYNNAGIVMDRNLGATSATPGDVKALGLLYQWGRKDPFLGSSSISHSNVAASAGIWYPCVSSSSTTGTISYAIAHPTTFICYNTSNNDWYYTGNSTTDNTRWNSTKGMYDPCPAGYRVPDGKDNGVWSNAFGTSYQFFMSPGWDSTNNGMNFATGERPLGVSDPIWYPASGHLSYMYGWLTIGDGYYWSCTTANKWGYYLCFFTNGNVHPSDSGQLAEGKSVRCVAE